MDAGPGGVSCRTRRPWAARCAPRPCEAVSGLKALSVRCPVGREFDSLDRAQFSGSPAGCRARSPRTHSPRTTLILQHCSCACVRASLEAQRRGRGLALPRSHCSALAIGRRPHASSVRDGPRMTASTRRSVFRAPSAAAHARPRSMPTGTPRLRDARASSRPLLTRAPHGLRASVSIAATCCTACACV